MSLISSIFAAFGGRNSGRNGTPRAAARLMVSHPVKLRPAPTGYEQAALLEDISSGGACVRTATKLRVGDVVQLAASMSLSLRFDQKARVVYALRSESGYQSRYGLRFIELRPDVKLNIARYVMEEQRGRLFGVQPFSHGTNPS